MTLISTVISNLGIVQSSDSNITDLEGSHVGTGQKVFPIRSLNGALSLAGTRSVHGEHSRLDVRLHPGYAATDSPSLGGFAEHLRARLAGEMTDDEKQRGILIHIAGYVTDGGHRTHPAMFFVRNVGMDPSTGDYVPGASVDLSEDFWARDYQKAEVKAAFGAGGYQRYFNGFPAGRITLLAVAELLQALFNDIRNQPRWQFRPPRNLGELAAFVELEIRAVAALFLSSDYSAPFIGGQIQTDLIPPPTDAVTL